MGVYVTVTEGTGRDRTMHIGGLPDPLDVRVDDGQVRLTAVPNLSSALIPVRKLQAEHTFARLVELLNLRYGTAHPMTHPALRSLQGREVQPARSWPAEWARGGAAASRATRPILMATPALTSSRPLPIATVVLPEREGTLPVSPGMKKTLEAVRPPQGVTLRESYRVSEKVTEVVLSFSGMNAPRLQALYAAWAKIKGRDKGEGEAPSEGPSVYDLLD